MGALALRRRGACHSLAAWLLLGICGPAAAERLPVRVFDSTHGLGHDRVRRIVPDSRGFLWFATAAGLSRFDGEVFRTYGVDDGLPSAMVTDVVEARDGSYWIATEAGVAHFRPAGAPPRFHTLPGGDGPKARTVHALHVGREGTLWAATEQGLFEREAGGGPLKPVLQSVAAFDVAEDDAGALWIATADGLWRRSADGTMSHHAVRPPQDTVARLLLDGSERLWLAHRAGLASLDTRGGAPKPGPLALRWHPGPEGRPLARVRALHEGPDGRIRVGQIGGGLTELGPEGARHYGTAHGLPDETINDVVHDREGHLWLATDLGGAVRLTRGGFVSYGSADGLGHSWVQAIFEDEAGALYAISGDLVINQWDERRFHSVWRPEAARVPGLHTYHIGLRDRRGEWWLPTAAGVLRFARPARFEDIRRARPASVYSRRSGLAGDKPHLIREDAAGDVWIAVLDAPGALSRWDRRQRRLHTERPSPDGAHRKILTLGVSGAGELWAGFDDGRLAYLRGGRWALLDPHRGLGPVSSLDPGRGDRLWIGHDRGLAVLETSSAQSPRLRAFAPHLAETPVRCVLDEGEHIFVGTARGLELLGPDGRRLRRFTRADGLPNDEVYAAFRDRRGRLWIGTLDGIARLSTLPSFGPPPRTYIAGLRLGGRPWVLSDLGETAVEGLTLGPDTGGIDVDYFACATRVGDPLLYQHRLQTDHEWSLPRPQRQVTLAGLAAGSYRFEVRAVDPHDARPSPAAAVSFRVLPPLWRRNGFLAGATILALAAAGMLHRWRLRRSVEIERVRTRIASDLHDDIGANLSLIAVLSEVARRGARSLAATVSEPLEQIASTARSSVDSMSDIVWAVDPSRDSLRELYQRMRQVAAELCAARGVELTFSVPEGDGRLDAGVRRELFLVFKEAVNNALRHSGCLRLEVTVALADSRLTLRVRDDGRGLPQAAHAAGNGLRNMRRRAEELGGALELATADGGGTIVTLTLPRRCLARRLSHEG